LEQLPACGSAHPGVRAVAEKMLVHGKEYLCVLKYSACFASEQLNSITTALAKVTQNLRRLVSELSKPKAHFTEQGIRNKIHRWLSDSFVREVLHYQLELREGHWQLTFEVNHNALTQLWSQRLGRTTLLTNRLDWTAEQVVAGYSGQQQIERVFRGLKDGDWLHWGPMHHWTDSKIRIHAFYCMLGVSLLQYVHRQSQTAWAGLTIEQLLVQLSQIQQFSLLYPPLGDKGPRRLATVLSKQSLAQQALADLLGLQQLCNTQRG
jgi:transposase